MDVDVVESFARHNIGIVVLQLERRVFEPPAREQTTKFPHDSQCGLLLETSGACVLLLLLLFPLQQPQRHLQLTGAGTEFAGAAHVSMVRRLGSGGQTFDVDGGTTLHLGLNAVQHGRTTRPQFRTGLRRFRTCNCALDHICGLVRACFSLCMCLLFLCCCSFLIDSPSSVLLCDFLLLVCVPQPSCHHDGPMQHDAQHANDVDEDDGEVGVRAELAQAEQRVHTVATARRRADAVG